MTMIPSPCRRPRSPLAGGQNVLIARIIKDFCSRYTPGGQVLYLGTAGAGEPVDRRQVFAHTESSSTTTADAGRGRPVIRSRWLAHRGRHQPRTGHALRKAALSDLSHHRWPCLRDGLPDMAKFIRFGRDIAWETDVWSPRTEPPHSLQWGEFLGPYDTSARHLGSTCQTVLK